MPNTRRVWVPGGSYFFTFNLLARRRRLLVERADDLRAAFHATRAVRPFEVIAIVILPDHLHCVWRLPPGDADNANRWAQIESGFSRRVPATERRGAQRVSRRERGIWQRRYWEHLVRDERDLRRHVDYVHFNPVKHGHVTRAMDCRIRHFINGCGTGFMRWGGVVRSGEDSLLEVGSRGREVRGGLEPALRWLVLLADGLFLINGANLY